MSQDITYDDVAKALASKTGWSAADIKQKVDAMIVQFNGLITETGAALIIGDNLGIRTNQAEKPEVKTYMYIKDVLEGTPKTPVPELVATILEVYERKDFTKKDGSSGFVIAAKLGDATGNCRFSFFNDTLKKLGIDSPSVGQVYTFKNCVIEAPYGDRATKNSLGANPPWEKVKSAITKGGTVPEAPAGTAKPKDEGNGLDQAIPPAAPAGKDYLPLLKKVVAVLVKKEVSAEGTGVDFTTDEQGELQAIIEAM
jgi:hypothetical protein